MNLQCTDCMCLKLISLYYITVILVKIEEPSGAFPKGKQLWLAGGGKGGGG